MKRRNFLISALVFLSGCCRLPKKKWVEEKRIAQNIIDQVKQNNSNPKTIKICPITFNTVNAKLNGNNFTITDVSDTQQSSIIHFSAEKNNPEPCTEQTFTYPIYYSTMKIGNANVDKIKEFVQCLA